MKKILYFFVATLLLLCGSCSDTNTNSTSNTSEQNKYKLSDTIDIDTCSNDTFIVTQRRINAQGVLDYAFYNDTLILYRDTLWSYNINNGITYYVNQYTTEELSKFVIL